MISKAIVSSALITQPHGADPLKVEKLELYFEGIKHDKHFGSTKLAGVREIKAVPKGTEIVNLRHVTIVSNEEMTEIANRLNIPTVTGEDLEANITLEGIPNLTQLPIGTILRFPKKAILYATGENNPCVVVGGRLAKRYGKQELTYQFPKSAMHKRGITAMVYAPGIIKKGDEVEIIYPEIISN